MARNSASFSYEFTRHARTRQGERGIPTCLVRLAIERGVEVRDSRGRRFVLGVAQLDAAGFGPSRRALVVVVGGGRILTVMWLDADARVAA